MPRLILPVLLLAALLASVAHGHIMFSRNGCGCLRNPVARALDEGELGQLRNYVSGRGVTHSNVLTDAALQAVFRFSILNNFPDVVPNNRAGVLRVVSQGFNELSDQVLPDEKLVGTVVQHLRSGVAELTTNRANIDLPSLVPAAAVVLHQRGVDLGAGQLQQVLSNGLSGFLQSPAFQESYTPLAQLVASLDHIDHHLPSILELESLRPVRAKLESRFNLDSKIFDARFKQAVDAFESNRQRILDSFNTLSSRGAGFEVTIQSVIERMTGLFPGTSSATLRSVLNLLQLSNSASGRARPQDLLSIVAIPPIAPSLRTVDDAAVRRFQLHLPARIRISVQQVREAYSLFIIGLASQGVQPLDLVATHQLFIRLTQQAFLVIPEYTTENYFLYVLRVAVSQVPRGSAGFSLRIFDPTVVVDNVLVPEPLQNIYTEGRKTIIERESGLQGSSFDISKRLERGEGNKPFVTNTVQLRPPIRNGPLPRYDPFSYGGVALSGDEFRQVSQVLSGRFSALSGRSLQEPILRVLIEAGVVSGSGSAAAAGFSRFFRGLPSFSAPDNLGALLSRLSSLSSSLQLTKPQLLGGLQQFFVTSRALGHIIPAPALPGVFSAAVGQFVNTVPQVRSQPFDIDFVRYLRRRLTEILQQVVLVGNSVPVIGSQLDKIFSGLHGLQISPRAQRAIIRFIDSGRLVQAPGADAFATGTRRLLAGLEQRYPRDVFVLPRNERRLLQGDLRRSGIIVGDQQLTDVNALALVGLGLNKRLDPRIKRADLRGILRRAIVSFLRINNVNNIPTSDFFRSLFAVQKAPLPPLPVPVVGQDQRPVPYTPAPIPIIDDLTLPLVDVNRLITLLRRYFPFVSIDNVQAILVHVVEIRRAASVSITQGNLLGELTSYLSGLPKSLAIQGVDIEELRKKIDASLAEVTITGNGIQSGLVELMLHLHYLNLPLPTPATQNEFFSFVIILYGRTVIRQQLRFGEPFYKFLQETLPGFGSSVAPFPIFSAPQLYQALEGQLSPSRLVLKDLPLYIQAVIQSAGLQGTQVSLPTVLQRINGISAGKLGPLSQAEAKGILGRLRSASLGGIGAPHVQRAFDLCRLAVRLSGGSLGRSALLHRFGQVVVVIVRQYKSLLVPQLVPHLVRLGSPKQFSFKG
ncbi:uncharacterized protein LOC119104914 [Pollicipes pollicipes]|uniref:Cement protein-100k n=1 Tax=Pollicipes pollicipes TaxID=41117 RepID=A0A290G6E8_POLPL|nr:uncharacterized protein LOC119104914 [Pollicipes pollicipes]ATB53757.1 cement protein-100k [Pollicipes pollicipes]